ncbi:MAG: hypothetical protein ABI675_20090 [Chitinophagaceae bacterium]
MNKYPMSFLAILMATTILQAQQKINFSGSWDQPELEMVSGIQYSNAVPSKISITQTKDSIKLERTSPGNDGDVTITETIALNGRQTIRLGKTSKRTITTSATWSKEGQTLTLVTIYSYAGKPNEAEYTNTEVLELTPDGALLITKTSDAAVTDDWTIKGIYQKS